MNKLNLFRYEGISRFATINKITNIVYSKRYDVTLVGYDSGTICMNDRKTNMELASFYSEDLLVMKLYSHDDNEILMTSSMSGYFRVYLLDLELFMIPVMEMFLGGGPINDFIFLELDLNRFKQSNSKNKKSMLYTEKNSTSESNKPIELKNFVALVQNDGIPKIFEFDLQSLEFKLFKKLNSTFNRNTCIMRLKDWLFVSNSEGIIKKVDLYTQREDSFELSAFVNDMKKPCIWKIQSFKEMYVTAADSFGSLYIIDPDTLQIISSVKDYNSDITNLIIINNFILTIGTEPKVIVYKFYQDKKMLMKSESKYIFKADCNAMTLIECEDADYLLFGGDEGYIKQYKITKTKDFLNLKWIDETKQQEVNSSRLHSQVELFYELGIMSYCNTTSLMLYYIPDLHKVQEKLFTDIKEIDDVPVPFIKLNFNLNIVNYKMNCDFIYVSLGKLRKLYMLDMKASSTSNIVIDITEQNKQNIKALVNIEFTERQQFFSFDVNKNSKIYELKKFQFNSKKSKFKSILKTPVSNYVQRMQVEPSTNTLITLQSNYKCKNTFHIIELYSAELTHLKTITNTDYLYLFKCVPINKKPHIVFMDYNYKLVEYNLVQSKYSSFTSIYNSKYMKIIQQTNAINKSRLVDIEILNQQMYESNTSKLLNDQTYYLLFDNHLTKVRRVKWDGKEKELSDTTQYINTVEMHKKAVRLKALNSSSMFMLDYNYNDICNKNLKYSYYRYLKSGE